MSSSTCDAGSCPVSGLCLVSRLITREGQPVRYMYREEAEDEDDSGWRFLSGEESEAWMERAQNFELLDIRQFAASDPSLLPWLDAPPGSEFDREDAGEPFFDSTE